MLPIATARVPSSAGSAAIISSGMGGIGLQDAR